MKNFLNTTWMEMNPALRDEYKQRVELAAPARRSMEDCTCPSVTTTPYSCALFIEDDTGTCTECGHEHDCHRDGT